MAGFALAVVTAAAVAGCGGGSQGTRAILFVSTRDGAYELYTMDADGGHQHRLTKDHGDASSPARLYYQVEPAWSPDGRRIAFTSLRDGRAEIFVVGADGTGTRRLTFERVPVTSPTWSPDGKRIAFARGTPAEIVVMDLDGTHLHRVSPPAEVSGDPAWSPDGRWIAYDRKVPGGSVSEIWVVHPNGRGQRRLVAIGANSVSPAWSPDSRRLAFASDQGGSTLGIYTIDISGRGLRRIVRTGVDAIEPAWSPDGRRISFSRDGAIVTVTLGGTVHQLTDPKNNDSSPVWNPRPRKLQG